MSEKREGAKLVELLHLALLQVMPSYLPVSDYAVKGGANLRLFYGSRRRSQDIDFDYLGSRFRALAQRHEAEPRDVFDLDLLLATYRDQIRPGEVDGPTLQGAIDAALSIPYETYADLVVQYIEDDFVGIYGRPEVWTDMTLGVAERLE